MGDLPALTVAVSTRGARALGLDARGWPAAPGRARTVAASASSISRCRTSRNFARKCAIAASVASGVSRAARQLSISAGVGLRRTPKTAELSSAWPRNSIAPSSRCIVG